MSDDGISDDGIIPGCSAVRIIKKFGSVYALTKALSEVTGRTFYPSTVSRWRKSRKNGGTGGHIPSHRHDQVLAAARRRGVKLTPEDFMVVDLEENFPTLEDGACVPVDKR